MKKGEWDVVGWGVKQNVLEHETTIARALIY
jgi:hypothetical protein